MFGRFLNPKSYIYFVFTPSLGRVDTSKARLSDKSEAISIFAITFLADSRLLCRIFLPLLMAEEIATKYAQLRIQEEEEKSIDLGAINLAMRTTNSL